MSKVRSLSIPARLRPAISKLAQTPDEDVQQIRDLLRDQPEGSRAEALALALVPHPFEDGAEAQQLIDALVSFNLWRSSERWDIADTAISVAASRDLSIKKDAQEGLASRIRELLEISPLWHLAKAFDMSTAHENSVIRLRILTDVRPIFEDDPDEPFRSAVVAHSLQITSYADNGQRLTSYFSLDATDLESLGEWVARATRKAATTEAMLGKVGVALHHTEEEA